MSDLVAGLETKETEEGVTRAGFTVTEECKNPMGGFHGGCQVGRHVPHANSKAMSKFKLVNDLFVVPKYDCSRVVL